MDNADTSSTETSSADTTAGLLDQSKKSRVLDRPLEGAAHIGATASTAPSIAPDILRGADQIAEYLFPDRNWRRKVYHLVVTGSLPVFRLGNAICARKSVLVAWIATQESQSR